MNRAPLVTEPFSADDTAVTTWPEAARGFAGAATFWLATTRLIGLMPVWAVWVGLFYASDRAGWITGTTMPIDGGVLAGRNAAPGGGRPRRRGLTHCESVPRPSGRETACVEGASLRKGLRRNQSRTVGASNARLLAVLDRWRAGKASANGRREALDALCVLLGVVGVQLGDCHSR
jgi:hypothetical protein